MDKNTKQLIANNIYSMVGSNKKFIPISDRIEMNSFFKQNGIHFKIGDTAVEVEQNGKLVAKGLRRFSYRRVCLEYKELKPQIEWLI